MIDAGIFPWDIAVVDKAKIPREGDIIIANIDYQYTIKYLRKDGQGRDYLQAANDNYMNIYPKEELQVFGVLVSIIRKY
jgi:repressor LexA